VSTKDVIDSYYRLANAGDWSPWCDLFTEDTVIDEQLAGHIEGRAKLREMMGGFPAMYASFVNTPRFVVVDGEQAVVFSHISAVAPGGRRQLLQARGRRDRLHDERPRHGALPSGPVAVRSESWPTTTT